MTTTTTRDALAHLLGRYPHGLSHTRAVKLLWLAELLHFEEHQERLIDAHWFKYDHGPFTKDVIVSAEADDHLFAISDVEWDGKSMRQLKVIAPVPSIPDSVAGCIDRVTRMFNRDRLQEILEHVYSDPFFESFEYGQDIDFSLLMAHRQRLWSDAELETISKRGERPYRGVLHLSEDED